jgi:chaperonin GroES
MLTPLKNRVLIEKDAPNKTFKTQDGFELVVPIGHEERPTYGTVIAVGSEVKDVIINDRVLFGVYDGTEIASKFIGYAGEFIMVTEDAIRAVVTNV